MIFRDFEVRAYPVIEKAVCKCGHYCEVVSNGFLAEAMFCPKCETVYELRMIKVPDKKVSKEYLEQCKKRTQFNER